MQLTTQENFRKIRKKHCERDLKSKTKLSKIF